MNQEESLEREEREERYRGSQDDITIIKKQIDRLTGVVGELANALKGDDFGNDGLVIRLKETQLEQIAINKRLDEIEMVAKGREFYIRIIWGLICFVIGTIFVYLLNRIIPLKKP